MSRYYEVLCEDLQSWTFIYQALKNTPGVDRRRIVKYPFPDSRYNATGRAADCARSVEGYKVYACGAQHVTMNFPVVLRAIRSRAARVDAALVVHIDVDNTPKLRRSVEDRCRDLDEACDEQKVARVGAADPVARLIARREIETWIRFLLGEPVDEETQYPKLSDHEADAEPAAKSFAEHARSKTVPPEAPPSLATGLGEFGRVI